MGASCSPPRQAESISGPAIIRSRIGEGDLAANPRIKHAELEFRAAHPGLTPKQLEPLYYRDALALHRGASRLVAVAARAESASTRSCRSGRRMRYTRPDIASRQSCVVLAPAAVRVGGRAADWRAGRSRPTRAVPAGRRPQSLVCLVFFPQERFRIPVIDPALIVCAAGAVGPAYVREHATERPRRRSDLQRTRQPARPGCGRSWRTTATGCSSSTTGRRTGPAQIADELAREYPGPRRGDAPHRASAGSAGRTSTACGTRSRTAAPS